MPYNYSRSSATIASGQSDTEAISSRGFGLKSIEIPASVEGTHFAFLKSTDGSTFRLVTDENGTALFPFTSDRFLELNPLFLLGTSTFKLRTCDSAGAVVNQSGGSAVLNLIFI